MKLALKCDHLDNVATIFANDVRDQDAVEVRDKMGESEVLTVIGDVPYGHKIALTDLNPGDKIMKYGECIGAANTAIRKGEYVHVHNMAATGAQVMMFSTGRGAPQGFCTMPVIKICGNPNTYARMSNDMDLNAGVILEGKKSIDEVGEEAFQMLLETLSGRMTKNEALSYFGSIDILCVGPVI